MDRRKRTGINEQTAESPFSLSIGDLMAALLLIFVLLLASTLLKVKEIEEEKKKETEEVKKNAALASDYISQKGEIGKDLKEEFGNKDYLKIEEQTLTIRFSENIFFDEAGYELNQNFYNNKGQMDDFFKRYIGLLQKHKKNINEIRIEGHTNSKPIKMKKDSYLGNMELSQKRAQSVLEYILKSQEINKNDIEDIKKLIVAIGFSYSKLLYIDNGKKEDEINSMRVEFSIRTKAEEKIEEIYKKGINDDQSRGNPQD